MDVRAIVSMPFVSGLSEDVAVNVLHFTSSSWDNIAVDVIRDHIVELFNVAPPAVPGGSSLSPIAAWLSNAIKRDANACSIKCYNLADPKPRQPNTRQWTLGPSLFSTANELPAEVALAVSIYAQRNIPRQRGRIFFGPFVVNATEDGTPTQRARPVLGLRESCGQAVQRLINKGANTQNLAVYSRGIYTVNGVKQPPVPGIAREVTDGWVDDAWDTQRRRGQKPLTRYSFT